MQLQQEAILPAPANAVWDVLLATERLVRVLPACTAVVAGPEGMLDATFEVRAMGWHERFTARFTRWDDRPCESFRVRVQAATRLGHIAGEGTVKLDPLGERTRIGVSGFAQVTGLLAALGEKTLVHLAEQALHKALEALAREVASP